MRALTRARTDVFALTLAAANKELSPAGGGPPDSLPLYWILMILVYLASLTSTSKLIRLKLCITFSLAELPINLFIPCLLPLQSPLNKFQLTKTAIQRE